MSFQQHGCGIHVVRPREDLVRAVPETERRPRPKVPGGQGKRRGPTPGRYWPRAAASSASAACRAFSPVRDIRAAISPVTIGVEKEVPLHLTMPAEVSRTSPSTIVLYFI